MSKLTVVLFPLVSLIALISLIFNLYFLKIQKSENTVTEVVDGDTFQLKSGKRVRLMGVDAPEYDRCGGIEAKRRLTELILGKTVEIKEEVTEAYGRSLALVYVGSTLVNKIILEEGWGRTDYRKNSQRDILTKAFSTAEKDKTGLWSLCVLSNPPEPPCLIKGNIDFSTYEKFYHFPSCRHYKETIINSAYGEDWFCSEKEAITAGFKKSASCP